MYSTGTASGPKATLQALATFATSAGWTVDNNAAYLSGWWLAVHKGSCYINFQADSADTQIAVYGATAFSGAATPSTQTNTSPGTNASTATNVCNCGAGPYTAYHFFSTSGSAAYLHVVIESSTNVFSQIHVGALTAVGGASPCIYLQMTNWGNFSPTQASYPELSSNAMPWADNNIGGYIGVTVDSTFRWFSPANSSPARSHLPMRATANGGNWQNGGFQRSPNTFNGLPIFFPIPAFVERAVGSIYAYVGSATDIRIVNIANNNPKDEITIGSDTWKLYPVVAKNGNINISSGAISSGLNYGYAFRKNA